MSLFDSNKKQNAKTSKTVAKKTTKTTPRKKTAPAKKPAQKKAESKTTTKKNVPQKQSQTQDSQKSNVENKSDFSKGENQYESHIFRIGSLSYFSDRLKGQMAIFVIANLILSVGVFRNVTLKPENAYIPVDSEYRISVNDDRKFSEENVMNFANEAALKTFSFTYLNFDSKLYDIYNNYYTMQGAQSLDKALSERRFFEYMKNRNILIIDSKIKENALIVQEGTLDNGDRAWVVDIPLELTIVTKAQQKTENYTYQLTIVEMPIEERRAQLGVAVIQEKE